MGWTLDRIETHSQNEVAYFYRNPIYPGICLTGVTSMSRAIYPWLKLLGVSNGYIDTDLKLPYPKFGDVGSHEFYTWPPRARPQFSRPLHQGPTIGPATTPQKGRRDCGYAACFKHLQNHPDRVRRMQFQLLLMKVHAARVQLGDDYGGHLATRKIHAMVLEEIRLCNK